MFYWTDHLRYIYDLIWFYNFRKTDEKFSSKVSAKTSPPNWDRSLCDCSAMRGACKERGHLPSFHVGWD